MVCIWKLHGANDLANMILVAVSSIKMRKKYVIIWIEIVLQIIYCMIVSLMILTN